MFEFLRYSKNPILSPEISHDWESKMTFNGSPAFDGKKTHFVYRAVSGAGVSTIGYASSRDGHTFTGRRQLIKPEFEWEKYGCEDPRITKFGDTYYIFYTALSKFPFEADGIKTAVAITKDFKKIKKYPVTTFNAKAMALFPEKINGKIVVFLSANTDRPPVKTGLAFLDSPKDLLSPDFWNKWYSEADEHQLVLKRSENDHVEMGAPPIKTKHGWLLLYSYIKNYFSGGHPIFGVEAVLLDRKNPFKIVARTDRPLITPHADYEKFGAVPYIVFPSGAVIRNNKIFLYYGAADTTCAVACGKLDELIKEMLLNRKPQPTLVRYKKNPVIVPGTNLWEAKAAFNSGALYAGNKVHLVYRAVADDNTSVFGYAESKNGFTISKRLAEPCYVPREKFEAKLVPNGNSGCEDPRLTKIGDKVYMLYTAFDGANPPRVALTNINYDDFAKEKWNWAKPVLISRPAVDDKDAAIMPEKINHKYAVLHRLGNNIWMDFRAHLDFENEPLLGKIIMRPYQACENTIKIGIAGVPIKAREGWLLVYHGIFNDNSYYLSAVLLDSEDPTRIIAKLPKPILQAETPYEKNGLVPNVVFSNGSAVIKGKLFVYYGGADKVLGVATIPMKKLMDELKRRKI